MTPDNDNILQPPAKEPGAGKETFLKQDLLLRGWTPGLIKRFLGEPDETPHRNGGGHYCIYSRRRVLAAEAELEWQQAVEHRQNRKPKPPKAIDLLAAIFAATRAAKRFRDAAQSCYQKGSHGFATTFRLRKEMLYALKDKGIAAGFATGRIKPITRTAHLVEYRGEGYCFHSTLLPDSTTLAEASTAQPLRVEAKPREAAEPRLKDALFTLESLPNVPARFIRLELPRVNRNQRRSVKWDGDDEGDGRDWDEEEP